MSADVLPSAFSLLPSTFYLLPSTFCHSCKGHPLGHYRVDLIVEGVVIIDIKSVERSTAVFEAQLLTYLKLMNKRVGLLINFNSALLKDGVTRLVL